MPEVLLVAPLMVAFKVIEAPYAAVVADVVSVTVGSALTISISP